MAVIVLRYRVGLFVLTLALSCAAPQNPLVGGRRSLEGRRSVEPSSAKASVDVHFGTRLHDEEAWSDDATGIELEQHATLGLVSNIPLAGDTDLVLGLWATSSGDYRFSGVDFRGRTNEFSIGLRQRFSQGAVQPYIGGGLSIVEGIAEGEADGVTLRVDGDATGMYASAGVQWPVGQALAVGVDLRVMLGDDYEVNGVDAGDSSYQQVTAFIGFRF